MGTFKWPLRIASMDGQRVQDMEANAGTGVFYTTLPGCLLAGLGIEPRGKCRVPQADGRGIDLDYGQARATIDGESVITLVVFGEDDSPALLGTYTLDGLAEWQARRKQANLDPDTIKFLKDNLLRLSGEIEAHVVMSNQP